MPKGPTLEQNQRALGDLLDEQNERSKAFAKTYAGRTLSEVMSFERQMQKLARRIAAKRSAIRRALGGVTVFDSTVPHDCTCCVCGKTFKGASVIPSETKKDAFCSLLCMSYRKPATAFLLSLALALAPAKPETK